MGPLLRLLRFEQKAPFARMSGPLLSLLDLKVYFFDGGPPVRAVDGVGFQIHPGETVALVGESGCGKTTLALAIGRLLPPRARIVGGHLMFQGKDLSSMSQEQIRRVRGRAIGYIFQDPMSSLNPVMTIGEQILESIRLHRQLPLLAERQLVIDLLRRVRISMPEQRARQYPHQLSGGMRQRVMIAMAIAAEPALLIADEPMTALDVTTQAEIFALLQELRKSSGMSILLISHDLPAVVSFADRIAVMYAGRIVELISAQQFFQAASHPYTQALLACLPSIGKGKQTLKTISGTVPDLRFTPPGCPFHPRCPEAIPVCRESEPELKPISTGHEASCWRREPSGEKRP